MIQLVSFLIIHCCCLRRWRSRNLGCRVLHCRRLSPQQCQHVAHQILAANRQKAGLGDSGCGEDARNLDGGRGVARPRMQCYAPGVGVGKAEQLREREMRERTMKP